MNILFIDCCITPDEKSRTKKLCNEFIKNINGNINIVKLSEKNIKPLNYADIEKRDLFIKQGNFSNDMFINARQFAHADKIIIGAPYWDLCFPSLLKVYFEHIFVSGITFAYEQTRVKGLCNAKKLIFIQSAGGFVSEGDTVDIYFNDMCKMLGIDEYKRVCAMGVDISKELETENMNKTKAYLIELAKKWF